MTPRDGDKYGVIGYGNMGRMLLDGFFASEALDPEQVTISSRTKSRLEGLEARWPGIEIAGENKLLAQKCDRIFICVKPLDVEGVLGEIAEHPGRCKHIICIAACVSIENLEKIFPGKITRVIPSLTSNVGKGISLVCHNDRVGPEDAECVERLFNAIGTTKNIEEENFGAAADLTSCAPGMIAAIFQEFVEAGIRHSSLTRKEAEEMVITTLYGTSKLLHDREIKFPELISQVATEGGITEEGLRVLRKGLPHLLDEVFKETLDKHKKIESVVSEQFYRTGDLKEG